MPEVTLRLEDVSLAWNTGAPGEVRALDGISLELYRGSFVVVLGGNGSGKSSLLGAIAGSLPVSTGRVTLDGEDVTRWPAQRRARSIGRVFQDPFTGTAPDLTVEENLSIAAR